MIVAKRIPTAVILDGRMDDASWRGAHVVTLNEQSPHPGQPNPYRTELRVLASPDTIYFGFRCYDPRPETIAVHSMQRDGDESSDDSVSVVLDPRGDHHAGYFFQVNAAGARVDGLISNAQNVMYEWDGIWDARTVKLPDGWSAVIAIPAQTLAFSPGMADWRLNVERFVPRDQITLRWSSPDLNSILFDMSRTGRLSGMSELKQGKRFEVSPYTALRTPQSNDPEPRIWRGALGADLTWKVNPQLSAILTLNPDFAETEVDSRQINLTRFPLMFPEKRAFFLEGANLFDFATGLGSQFVPFFSRTVGLWQGTPVPLHGGLKLNGRVGRWSLAVLDLQTRSATLTGYTSAEKGASVLPSTNLLASRIAYDVNEKLRLGTVITNGDPAGVHRNTLAGFDAVWRTSKFRGNHNLLASMWTATTQGDTSSGDKWGWGIAADYPNDFLNCSGSLNHFGNALEPRLGFLPRPGTQQLNVGCAVQPRPSKKGFFRKIRQAFFDNRYSRVTNSEGVVESWSYFTEPLNINFESGETVAINWSPQSEKVLQSFELSRSVVISPGTYNFARWGIEAHTSSRRRWQLGSTTSMGTFYSGRLTQQQSYFRWTSTSGRVQLGLEAEDDFGHLPQGGFVEHLWQAQSLYAWNPNLALTFFVQYDTAAQSTGTSTRLRWTMKPGSELFVVWKRSWQSMPTPQDSWLVPQKDVVAIKLRRTFRW